MDSRNSFFKWVWRVNALGIAFLVGLGSLLGGFFLYTFIKDHMYRPHVHNVINIDKNSTLKEEYKLGSLTVYPKSSYGHVPLYLDQHIQGRYASKHSDSNIVNYLFINLKDGQSHWLFDHNKYLILKIQSLPDSSLPLPPSLGYPDPIPGSHYQATSSSDTPQLLIFEVVRSDSNQDNRLSDKDLKTIALSKVDGRQYTEVFSQVKTIYGATISSHGDLVLVFEDIKGSHVALISKDDFIVKHIRDIPLTH